MRKKLLQNTLFVAIAAWSLYLAQTQAGTDTSMSPSIEFTQVFLR